MNEAQALQKVGPQSTALDLTQAPNQSVGMATTVVALDRENLQFFANMIRGAGLVPQVNGVAPDVQFNRVMAKIVAGTSYGFDPMLSQTAFHVMFDQLTLSAQGHEILFRRSGEYDTRIVKLDDDGCKVKVLKLIDGVWKAIGEVEFTRKMAEKAQLTKNAMYSKFGPDMFFARVMTRVVKRFNPGCLQPTVVLGNHFARESQASFNLPPQQISNEALPPAPPVQEAVPHVDPTYDGAEVLVEEEIEGEVTEYSEPLEVDGDASMATVDSEPVIDTEESKHLDLLTAAKDRYLELDKETRKGVDEWLGQRLMKDLSIEELAQFLESHPA